LIAVGSLLPRCFMFPALSMKQKQLQSIAPLPSFFCL
jgi:hypothetical protein